MSTTLVAIGSTLGTPVVSGQVPINSSSLSGGVNNAVTDLATLATAITASGTAATTADTNAGIDVTNTINADNGVATAQGDEAAITVAINAALANGTISGNPTALGLVTTIQTDFATMVTDLATAKGLTAAARTSAATTKASTASAKTDATGLSTSAVSADLTAAQTVIAGMDLYSQTDTSLVTTAAQLQSLMQSALNFAIASGMVTA